MQCENNSDNSSPKRRPSFQEQQISQVVDNIQEDRNEEIRVER